MYMRNMWGERLNKRHIFDWFVFFLSLFFSSILLTVLVLMNWQEINAFIKLNFFKEEVSVEDNGVVPPAGDDSPIEIPDGPEDPVEPEPETPTEPSEPEIPVEPEEPQPEPEEPEVPVEPTPEPETPTEPSEPEPTPEPEIPEVPVDPEAPIVSNLVIEFNSPKFDLDTTTATGNTYGTITATYGENLNFSPDDFKLTSFFEDNSSKELANNDYIFVSNIPTAETTPAGRYVIKIKYSNYKEISIEIVINKSVITFSPSWNYLSPLLYSGTEQEVVIENLPDTLLANYTGTNKAKNAGTYSTTATFTPKDSNNFICNQTTDLNWEITKASLLITANDCHISYGDDPANNGFVCEGFLGTDNESCLEGLITFSYNYVKYDVTGPYKITPGGYTSDNYNIMFIDGTLYVDKVIVDTSVINTTNIKLRATEFEYTGSPITVLLDDYELPEGITLRGLNGNRQTNPGTYEAVAVFECSDSVNYQSFTPISLTLSWKINETAYQKLIGRLLKLEELAKAYDSDNWQINMLSYIRSAVYNDSEWSIVAGAMDENFVEYVATNQGSVDLNNFRNNTGANATFVAPSTKETIDFYHMFAVMNVVYKGNQSSSDLSGWAGDLVQMMGYIKNTGLTGSALLTKVRTEFNALSTGYGFGKQDVCADLDAVNIIKIYKSSGDSSIVECMDNYYQSITEQERVANFKSATFSGGYSEASILSRLSSNFYIMGIGSYGLAAKYGVTISDSNEICTTCIKVFVEYLDSFA